MPSEAPVIRSLLETDLYKFTMWQALYNSAYNDNEAEYRFVCRRPPTLPLSDLKDAVNREVEHLGPGTKVKTKSDVSGHLLVPRFLVEALREHADSIRRIRRLKLAGSRDSRLLFLTVKGRQYEGPTFRRLMTELRRSCTSAGLHFMKSFKFHQTRATFGSWMLSVLLKVATPSVAIGFLRDAMHHADEATTFLYLRHEEETPVKEHVANAFSAFFTGVANRNWTQYPA